jgi:hypothetical protein
MNFSFERLPGGKMLCTLDPRTYNLQVFAMLPLYGHFIEEIYIYIEKMH